MGNAVTYGYQLAVITDSRASSSDIGYAFAKGLAGAGASVVLNGRIEVRAAEATVRLKQDVPEAEVKGVAVDLGGLAGVHRLKAFLDWAHLER